jgi:hypothetical protein
MRLKRRLATVYNRGFWRYYLGSEDGEWNNRYGSAAQKEKSIRRITIISQKLR